MAVGLLPVMATVCHSDLCYGIPRRRSLGRGYCHTNKNDIGEIMLFVSYWTMFKSHHTEPFISNMEVPFDEVKGQDDVRLIEKYIKDKLNAGTEMISCVSIINWKRFNT